MSARGGIGAERVPIQSTAGAIPVKNEKGEISMQKVKVKRYVPGKRPDFAPQFSSGEEEEEEGPFVGRRKATSHLHPSRMDLEDARLRRLRERHRSESSDEEEEERERIARHRQIHQPEVIDDGDDDDDDDEEDDLAHRRRADIIRRFQERPRGDREDEGDEEEDEEEDDRMRFRERDQASRHVYRMEVEESSSDEEELDEEEIEKRRSAMRARARQRAREEEVLGIEEDAQREKVSSEEEESSEYEEYTDSEEEDGPRLKPVFVAKKDRVTIQEKEIAAIREREQEEEAKKKVEERKRETVRMVEMDARQLQEAEEDVGSNEPNLNTVNTDDENDEVEYEGWKVRELRRIKRERDLREQIEKERQETERLRNMTEEERREELRVNPKQVTNKQTKGRYKFLQKYYHRGAFYLNEEEDVLKRDVSGATLEDHFDKTVLPKVMQVKNFGRSGRTKYTHLVDQDTTSMESPWANETAVSRKFQASIAGGMKQSFEKPTARKSRKGAAT